MGAGSSQKQFHTTKHSEALTLLSYSTSLSVSSYIPGRFQQISDVHVSLLLLSGFLWLVGLRRSRGICSFFEPELSSIEVRNGWWGWWGWEGGGESGCTLLRSRAMLIFMWKGYSCSVALKKLFMLYSNADPRGDTHTHTQRGNCYRLMGANVDDWSSATAASFLFSSFASVVENEQQEQLLTQPWLWVHLRVPDVRGTHRRSALKPWPSAAVFQIVICAWNIVLTDPRSDYFLFPVFPSADCE